MVKNFSINIAIIGVGNCASSLIQGVGEGVVLIEVEHHRREPVNDTFWGMVWRTFTRDCIKWREIPYRAVYKPDEVRYQKE